MQFSKFIRLLPLLWGLCTLTLSFFAVAGNGILYRALPGKPVSLDPHKFQSNIEALLHKDLYEGLTVQDEEGKPVPGMAESWSVSDDGLTWTFKMRSGLKWSDGEPLTANDFEYSFRRLADPVTQSHYSFYLTQATVKNSQDVIDGKLALSELGVESQNDDTLVIALERPCSFLPSLLTFPAFLPVPWHIVERHDEQWAETPGVAVSNGPYTLTGQGADQWMMMKNNNYHLPLPEAPMQLVWKHYDSVQQQLKDFYSGELHVTTALPEALKNILPPEHSVVQRSKALTTTYVLINGQKPELSDDVRQALALIIQKEALPPFGEPEEVAKGLIPPWTDGAESFAELTEESQYERDKKAQEAWGRAGYSTTKPLRLSLLEVKRQEQSNWKKAVVQQWKRLPGLEVAAEGLEWQDYNERVQKGEYQLALGGWIGAYNKPPAFLLLGSKRLSPFSSSVSVGSATIQDGYDAALTASVATGDSSEYERLHHSLLKRNTIVPLAHPKQTHWVQSTVKNYTAKNPEGWMHSRHLSLMPKS